MNALTETERREIEDELEQALAERAALLCGPLKNWKSPIVLEAHDRAIARMRRLLTETETAPPRTDLAVNARDGA